MKGQTIRHYHILEKLGAGGMGEVYRAEDTRLRRAVAIKVLPEQFTKDAERLARFEREAQLVAALNHPNIAAVYGLEESEGVRFLVLELVEGITLAERIKRGALPVQEALQVGLQMAQGLEAAHGKGIIHRDLKPSNVTITPEGNVKLLDFGLAKALEGECSSDISDSPTLTAAMTRAGVILGTPSYMSPEQARGKAVDRKADVWAFGCVLFECLTGQKVFEGEDVTDVLASIVRGEPDWKRLPASTPWNIRLLLRRCLEKDSKRRLQDIGDARLEIEDTLQGSLDLPAGEKAAPKRWRIATVTSGILVLALILSLAAVLFRTGPVPGPLHVSIALPSDLWLDVSATAAFPSSLSVSPDGQKIALSLIQNGILSLWVRSLDSRDFRRLEGTEGVRGPFWSPDGRSIGFFAEGKLKRIDLAGGPARILTDAPNGIGGTWGPDGTILFNRSYLGPVFQMPAAGGTAVEVTRLDTARKESSHLWPRFLPDGKHFLYYSKISTFHPENAVYWGSLDSEMSGLVVNAQEHPSLFIAGHLLFVRDGVLWAQRFNVRRRTLEGEPIAISENLGFFGRFGASENTFTYTTEVFSEFAWYSRDGQRLGTVHNSRSVSLEPQLSPDGRLLATHRASGPVLGIWMYDLDRGTFSRFVEDSYINAFPRWSPDGRTILFMSNREGPEDFYIKPVSGVAEARLLYADSVAHKHLLDWSRDGQYLLYWVEDAESQGDLWALPLSGEMKPFPVVRTKFEESSGRFSPDGSWIAYTSDESGRPEIYVQRFPKAEEKWQVSNRGGNRPRWSRDGREIFYIVPGGTMTAVDVKTGATFERGEPKELFTFPLGPEPPFVYNYDVTADGQRFVISTRADDSRTLEVILNWTALLQ